MAGIDDVLERLLTDTAFARNLAHDPAGALAGYELTPEDLSLLSSQVSFDPGALSLVEERISKSSMFGLLTSITGGLGGGEGQLPGLPMSPGVMPVIGMEEVVGPSDSEGPIGVDPCVTPIDSVGIGGPGDGDEFYFKEVEPGIPPPDGDMGDPIEPGATAPDVGDHGTGGGAGSEVYFKEVEPGMEPDVGDHGTGGGAGSEVYFKEVDPGTPPDGGDHGTGGGAGSEVSIKEVDPAPQPTAEGGIVVQGGLTEPEGIVVQGG